MLKMHKVVSQLPEVLEADSIYFVRVGQGVDIYVTNSAGLVIPFRHNERISATDKEKLNTILQGGKPGYALTKNSDTDGDYTWKAIPTSGGGTTPTEPQPGSIIRDQAGKVSEIHTGSGNITLGRNQTSGKVETISSGGNITTIVRDPQTGKITSWEVN